MICSTLQLTFTQWFITQQITARADLFLKKHVISGSLLDWFIDYLSNRSQGVVIRYCISTSKSVHAGVSQGSFIGPLLFLIYFNDIIESLRSLTRLFVDDSSLFYSASSIIDLQGIINHDLQILSAWAKQWLISFNDLKTEAVLFTLRHFTNLTYIILDSTLMKFVSDLKHLGLALSMKGQWHKHIENIVSSSSEVNGIMCKLKFLFHRAALIQISLSYVLPILEYSAVVFGKLQI